MKKCICFVVLFCFSLNTIALPRPPAAQTAPVSENGSPFKLTPQILRERLLNKNLSILQELESVYQAKDTVNVARSQLLPAANFGLALNFQGSGFFLSSISFLLPFLVPSNWFNYKESKYLFEAEKFSYYLLKLNLYASAYSTLTTMHGDRELRKVAYQQYQNFLKIQEIIQIRHDFGMQSNTDLTQAKAQTQLSLIKLAQADKLLIEEKNAIQALLALPISTEIDFSGFVVAPSPYEEKTPAEALEQALKISPEYSQIGNLISASKAGKWSKAYAFMNSSALSIFADENRSLSFSNMRADANLNLTLGVFPAISLTQSIIKQLELRKEEIKTEQARIIESNLGVLAKAKLQLEQAVQAEEGLNKVLQEQTANYSLGLTDLLHVIDTQNSVTEASTARVQSQMELNNLRVTLHRTFLSEEFAKIQPCKAVQEKNSAWTEIKGFFSSREAQKIVDQQCKGPKK